MNDPAITIEHFYERGIYLGHIEWEGCEVYPVIRHPKFEKPIIAFSSGLSFRMLVGGNCVFSKGKPEKIGKTLTLDDPLFDNTYKGELTPNKEVSFEFDGFIENTETTHNKGILIDYSVGMEFSEDDELHYFPESLKNTETIPRGGITFVGQIVSEIDTHFIVDAGVFLFVDKERMQGLECKLGDWVSGKVTEINFV